MHNSNFYIILFIVAAVYFLIDWYVFQGVRALTAGWQAGFARQAVHGGYWLAFVALTGGLAYTFLTLRTGGGWTPFTQGVFNAFLILFVTKLVFMAVLFSEDVFRIAAAVVHFFRDTGSEVAKAESLLPARRKFVSQMGLLLASVPFASILYGVTKGKYDYRVHRQTLFFDDLPESFDGFTVVQLSDIHSGSFDDARAVQKGIDLVKAQNADLFVFTGDLVNHKAAEIEPWLQRFSQVKAPYGQFSILGNHDYGDYSSWNSAQEKAANFERLKQHHATLGYRLLLDENVTIQKDGQKISLLGVENWGVGFGKRGNLSKALAGVEDQAFKILLSHDPSHWDAEVKHHPAKMHLTLSGHTHGMQFGVELPGLKWSPVKYRYPNWAGLAQENDRYLYVNRGFGFHGFSGRVGIWPEITVMTLRKRIA
jgi:predicted MPP superfamily phosphohydrolase